VVHKIEDIEEYANSCKAIPRDQSVVSDMLINVTSFFRGPRVFDAMKFPGIPSHPENHCWGGLPGLDSRMCLRGGTYRLRWPA